MTMNDMTMNEAKRIYIGAGGPIDHTDREWLDIYEEMQAIVTAKTDRAGGDVIRWWDCWDRACTATAFARQVRQLHREGRQ